MSSTSPLDPYTALGISIAQAMRCATPPSDNLAVAASILLGCTPQCLGAIINSATRYRSASVTGLAPSPRCPWDCEKSCDAMRNLRGTRAVVR